VNSLPKTVTRPRRGCDLNPGPSAPESSTLTTRLPSHAPADWLQNTIYNGKQSSHRPPTPPRCCHLASYFKHTSRSSRERPLPATGIPTRQAQGCIRVSLAGSAWRRRRAASYLMCKYDVIHNTGNTKADMSQLNLPHVTYHYAVCLCYA